MPTEKELKNEPKTRLQQMVERATGLSNIQGLTEEDQLLDRQAGLYSELVQSSGPEEVAEILTATSALLQEQGFPLKENLLQPALAATLFISSKAMETQKIPAERSGEVLQKVGGIFGVKPEVFTGTPITTLANIMERDLDLQGFENDIRRFGFEVKDGAIGGWNAPAQPSPKSSPKPPRQLG